MRKEAKDIVASRLDALMNSHPEFGSQQKLAKKTGIGQTTIGRIRRGEVNATADNLQSIADAFRVPISYLFGEDAHQEKYHQRTEDGLFASQIEKMVAVFCKADSDQRETIMQIISAMDDEQRSLHRGNKSKDRG